MAKTNIATESLEAIMKDALMVEVKSHLLKMIDNDLEKIARDAVQRFLEFEIHQQLNAASMMDEIYFSFVNNITKTVIETKVIKEKDNG